MFSMPYIVIPTYNEKGNIQNLISLIFSINPQYHVLIVDDNSPDGTFKIVNDMMRIYPNLSLLHRLNEKGRGTAGIAGFLYAIDEGADAILEMDADFSHNPADIPRLFEKLEITDLVIGSRAAAGGDESGRPAMRQIITKAASYFIKLYLKLPVADPTSGFRAFRTSFLKQLPLKRLKSKGPSIVEELLYYAHRKGAGIEEIPIHFEQRKAGKSTFNLTILFQTLFFIFLLPFRNNISRI